MIPGGWVGAATFFIVVGVVLLWAIFVVHETRQSRLSKRHEREMAKLEHRQSLDEMAIEAEFASDDDGDDDEATTATLVPTERVECLACGRSLPKRDAHMVVPTDGPAVPSCRNNECRTDVRAIVDPSRPP